MNINQVWPEWQEDCVLGEGSFGKVYRAKRVEYGRTFYSAIKVLTVPKGQHEIRQARAQGMTDTDIYNYFQGLVDNLLNEITLMDNLKGAKNIVGIEDYKIIERQGEIGWDIFIRMELLTPFDSFVSNPEFSQKDVVKLGVDLCAALEICEQNFIVHRDIKPDNIFISRFGEYKLGDFGIARKLEVTQANLSRKGTLNYMAPEVYKSEEYGSNVDIYSLGLVLYTLLNNNRSAFLPPYPQPISYNDSEQALTMRLSGQPLPVPCNASPSLAQVILKACAYRPQDRYHSATEFKNALIAEWNKLVQTGENGGVYSAPAEVSLEGGVYTNTNDMTSNSPVVAPGTTVLDDYSAWHQSYGAWSDPGAGIYASQHAALTSEERTTTKIFRILGIPVQILTLVMAVWVLGDNSLGALSIGIALNIVCMTLTMLLSRNNRFAAGIAVCAVAMSPAQIGLASILDGLQDSFPIEGTVMLLIGLMLLFGGIVMMTQKQVRFGGTLCFYAFLMEWLLRGYQMLNGDYMANLASIVISLAALAAGVWAYGYEKNCKPGGIRLVLFILAFIPAAVSLGLAVLWVFSYGMLLF